MDATELFVSLYDSGASQLGAVFADLPADAWDKKLSPGSMSSRETVAHLTEAYIACAKHLNGEEHSWGTYEAVSDDPQRLLAEMNKQRDVLKAAALEKGPSEYREVLAYSSNHDHYHVGQMVALRLEVQPDWDSYSIYA